MVVRTSDKRLSMFFQRSIEEGTHHWAMPAIPMIERRRCSYRRPFEDTQQNLENKTRLRRNWQHQSHLAARTGAFVSRKTARRHQSTATSRANPVLAISSWIRRFVSMKVESFPLIDETLKQRRSKNWVLWGRIAITDCIIKVTCSNGKPSAQKYLQPGGTAIQMYSFVLCYI